MARQSKKTAFVENQPLNAEALCLVHATAYRPTVLADGTAAIQTTASATNGRKFRNSIHFALNHRVAGHELGSWDNALYTVISDFQLACAANGPPTALCTVDSWWTRGWKEDLQLPKATVVEPSVASRSQLVVFRDGVTTYKSKNFRLSEVFELCQANRHLATEITDVLHKVVGLKATEQFWADLNELAQSEPELSFLMASEQYVEFKDVSRAKVEPTSYSLADSCKLRKPIAVAESIEQLLCSANNRQAVTQTIEQLGYPVQRGGKWSWEDSFGVTQSTTLLAQAIGSRCMHHGDSVQSDLEFQFSRLHRVRDCIAAGEKFCCQDANGVDFGFFYEEAAQLGKFFEQFVDQLLKKDGVDARTREVVERMRELYGGPACRSEEATRRLGVELPPPLPADALQPMRQARSR